MRFLSAVLLLSVGILPAEQNVAPASQGKTNQQLEDPAPVDVAPEPTDPGKRALRAIRNRLQNSPRSIPSVSPEPSSSNVPSAKRSPYDSRLPGPAISIFVDRAPFPPNARPEDFQLPVAQSDVVLLGSVTKVQPYLSEDGTSLYTEYTISVEEVFKESANLSPKTAGVITLFRIGGSLRLASGRVVRTVVHGLGDPPVTSHRYVCFLQYDARGSWFRIVKVWELRNGAAAPTR